MRLRGFVLALGGVLVAVLVAIGLPAGAAGVTRVNQSDGSVQTYTDVRVSLKGQTLWIASADHKGTLEIVDGACSFIGGMQRCLPYAVTLHQHGQSHAIAIDRGTVYLNLSDTPQHLRRSSKLLAPRNVLVALHTNRGTFVSVEGSLDVVQP